MGRAYTRDEGDEIIVQLRCCEVVEERDFGGMIPYGDDDDALAEMEIWRWVVTMW